jgi:hypothetical protein
VATVIVFDPKGVCVMFDELTEELLDLSANVRGHGDALYAVVDEGPTCSNCCALCSTIILCIHLCW